MISDFIVIGDIYILTDNNPDKKVDNHAPTIPQQVKNIQSFKNKLKNDVTNTVQPGIVKRPSAGELLAKDEPPEKKEADSAMRESLDQIPELREAKKILEEQKK